MSDTNIVSPLRRRMIEEMTARKLTSGTQRSHLQSCRRFAAWLKRSLDTATPDDVRQFQLHIETTPMRRLLQRASSGGSETQARRGSMPKRLT